MKNTYLLYEQGSKTVTSDRYFDTMVHLCQAMKVKRPGLLSRGVIIIHDNVTPHTSGLVCTLRVLTDFGWYVFQHPPYSPDLAPSHYYLFCELKQSIGGQRFQSNAEVERRIFPQVG